MPQAPDELRAKFKDDSDAWDALKEHFDEKKFLIHPKVEGYVPTEREADAIDYLVLEWDWEYDSKKPE